MDPLLCLGCFFLLAGFVTDVISTASREWVVNAAGATSGLWTVCPITARCMSMAREEALDATRAMMVISVVISGPTLLVVIVDIAAICINGSTNRWVLRAVTTLSFLSVSLTLASVLVSERIDWRITNTEYSYSFWLAVASVVLFFIAAIFFLASVIRQHRERRRHQTQTSQKAVKKEYPFIIPYYNYEGEHSHEDELAAPETERMSEGKKLSTHPFQYDYRYYPTSPVTIGVYSSADTGVMNPHYSTAYPAGQQSGEARGITIDNFQGSVYSKPRQTSAAPTNSIEGTTSNTGPSSVVTSRTNTKSMYGRGVASSRAQRDVLGYPLNYSREL